MHKAGACGCEGRCGARCGGVQGAVRGAVRCLRKVPPCPITHDEAAVCLGRMRGVVASPPPPPKGRGRQAEQSARELEGERGEA